MLGYWRLQWKWRYWDVVMRVYLILRPVILFQKQRRHSPRRKTPQSRVWVMPSQRRVHGWLSQLRCLQMGDVREWRTSKQTKQQVFGHRWVVGWQWSQRGYILLWSLGGSGMVLGHKAKWMVLFEEQEELKMPRCCWHWRQRKRWYLELRVAWGLRI